MRFMTEANPAKLAILIDAENVLPSHAEMIFSTAMDMGEVVAKEIYGVAAALGTWVEPVLKALKAKKKAETTVLIMAPIGKRFDQKMAHELSLKEDLLIICGHYEGMDARIYDYADELISIGDYILTGGELAAMVVCDSLLRLLDGSMKKESVIEESFEEGLLEYPQYTRPAEYDGKRVPEVLLSGDHEKIRQWRKQEARKLTELRRPDLLEKEK